MITAEETKAITKTLSNANYYLRRALTYAGKLYLPAFTGEFANSISKADSNLRPLYSPDRDLQTFITTTLAWMEDTKIYNNDITDKVYYLAPWILAIQKNIYNTLAMFTVLRKYQAELRMAGWI